MKTQTIAWDDLGPALAAARDLDGLSYLQRLREGTLPGPPIAALFGMNLTDVDEGRAVFTGTAHELHLNPMGTVHGGFYMTLLDSSAGCAVLSTCARGSVFTTLTFDTQFQRGVVPGTTVRCEGIVTHRGRRIVTATATLRDERERICASATTTCLIIEQPAAEQPT